MIEKRPQLVDANLKVSFTSMFLGMKQGAVSDIMLHLKRHFNPVAVKEGEDETGTVEEYQDLDPSTRLILGGRFSEACRSIIEGIMDDTGISNTTNKSDACAFVGSFCDSGTPANLSLHRLAQRCGIELNTAGLKGLFTLDVSGVRLLEGAQKNEVKPEKDFSALSPLFLGRYSASAYYISASDDEKGSREAVIKLLAFAVDSGQTPGAAVQLDFLPAPPGRRRLVHEICDDLGLAHSTVDSQFGKFVRVSSPLDGKIDHTLEQSMNTLSISHTGTP